MEIIDYYYDLVNYYKCSYGLGPISRNMACLAVKDMIQDMASDNNPPQTKVTAYFSQSTLILLMLSAFGAQYDSTPLLANNYYSQQNRKFRISDICPFAANIAAIKYQCKNNDNKVLFLLNQLPLKMNWCRDGEICTITELKKMFMKSTMRTCPFDICEQKYFNNDAASNKSNSDYNNINHVKF